MKKRKKALRAQIITGCEDMADIYLEIERDFHPLEEEIHRIIDK